MRAINLYQLTRIENPEMFSAFEKHLSLRSSKKLQGEHETRSLSCFVRNLIDKKATYSDLDYFYYSFSVPQIGKEFDLLRINDDFVLNVELKSEFVSEEKICKQLVQNKSYLLHLSNNIKSYTYVSSDNTVYSLNMDNELEKSSLEKVLYDIKSQNNCYQDDISVKFKVSDYLVSPLTTPEKFLNKEYFLTPQQENIKKELMNDFSKNKEKSVFRGLTGNAGTGKTLALYDLAAECSQHSKTCIIHCGMTSTGHVRLTTSIDNLDIFPIKNLYSINFPLYDFIYIDESQRLRVHQLEMLVPIIEEHKLKCVFSYDDKQTLSQAEVDSKICEKIKNLTDFREYKLTNKIRTNKEVASFIKKMMDTNFKDEIDYYPSVSVSYANNIEEAATLLKEFKKDGYYFINYTPSRFSIEEFQRFITDGNTHQVIGHEYDDVIMVIDNNFRYNQNGQLVARKHPNPDYLFRKLVYQGITRTRENLALIILNNKDAMKTIMDILS